MWAWHRGAALEAKALEMSRHMSRHMSRPGDGAVADGAYTNKYFHLSYPVPSGWTEATPGPRPSHDGYYVLATLTPAGEFNGTILIAAQDAFFAAATLDDLTEAAREFAASIAKVDGMTVERPPSEVVLAGRAFRRVDFNGVGLFRSTFLTLSRCHLVSFHLTANSPDVLAGLVRSLNELGDAGDRAAGPPDPACVRNHATAENIVTKVDPAASAPTFTPIPVRMVIGADGAVKHVNVIRATAAQRDSIESALGQWKFKPHDRDAADIETGLLIEFTPGGVSYPAVDRR
jgi:hypothetical protein